MATGASLGDLFCYDPRSLLWAAVDAAGTAPLPRYAMGMAAMAGNIYVCAGGGQSGQMPGRLGTR